MKRALRLDGKTWREQDAEAKQRIYQHHASREIGECLEDNLILKEEGETNYAVLISTRSYKNYGNVFESWITEIDVEVKEGSFRIVPLQTDKVTFPKEDAFTRLDPSDPKYVKALKARVKEAEATSDLAKQLFLGLIDRAEEAEKRAERAEFDLAELKAENIRLQENINVLIQLNEANNDQRTV